MQGTNQTATWQLCLEQGESTLPQGRADGGWVAGSCLPAYTVQSQREILVGAEVDRANSSQGGEGGS